MLRNSCTDPYLFKINIKIYCAAMKWNCAYPPPLAARCPPKGRPGAAGATGGSPRSRPRGSAASRARLRKTDSEKFASELYNILYKITFHIRPPHGIVYSIFTDFIMIHVNEPSCIIMVTEAPLKIWDKRWSKMYSPSEKLHIDMNTLMLKHLLS